MENTDLKTFNFDYLGGQVRFPGCSSDFMVQKEAENNSFFKVFAELSDTEYFNFLMDKAVYYEVSWGLQPTTQPQGRATFV